MTSTVATEIPHGTVAPSSPLETPSGNEPMRHIPSADWIIGKIDGDLRRRIDVLCTSFGNLEPADTQRAAAEAELSAVCRALDRLADIAKHARHSPHPADVGTKVKEALNHAVSSLRAMDPNLFGRRAPFHTFERSKSEPLVAALLIVIAAVQRATDVLRVHDSRLDERLLEGLVTLREPLRSEPIA
jgi:hypothetical protein